MKKYYQLTLVIVSLLSVSTLLFYRHEYYRLRYVLEVLNFFGKPGQIITSTPGCYAHNVTGNSSIYRRFEQPLPSWQRLTDRHFVYSAFWEETAQSGHVRAISLAYEAEKSHFKCTLWYEDKENQIEGKFFIQIVENKELSQNALEPPSGNVYYLYCKPKISLKAVPFGVSFYKTDEVASTLSLIPVYYNNEPHSSVNGTAICVRPDVSLKFLNSSWIIQFLSFYLIIGVNNVIVYGGGLPNQLFSFLKSSEANEKFGINLFVLPWNPPFSGHNLIGTYEIVLELDCLLRTSGKMKNAAIVDWNEYVVPRYHRHLAAMLEDFDSGRKITGRFKIPVLTFCTNWADDNSNKANAEAPLALRKTRYSTNLPERTFYVFRPQSVVGSKEPMLVTQRMSPGIASVHRYSTCTFQPGTLKKEILYEPAMLRFSKEFSNSKMLKLWNSGKLF